MDQEILFYIGLIGTILYIAYCTYMQIISNDKRSTSIEFAKSEYESANENFKLAKAKLLKSVSEVHGNEQANKVAQGIIWMAMPKHLLLVAKGKAYDIKESYYKETKTEKWYYGEYINRLGNYKYTLEITLENDEVVGWKDLK